MYKAGAILVGTDKANENYMVTSGECIVKVVENEHYSLSNGEIVVKVIKPGIRAIFTNDAYIGQTYPVKSEYFIPLSKNKGR